MKDRRMNDIHFNYKPINWFTLAALILLVLKITGIAHFSAWWIVLVFFGPLVIFSVIVAFLFVLFLIAAGLAAIAKI